HSHYSSQHLSLHTLHRLLKKHTASIQASQTLSSTRAPWRRDRRQIQCRTVPASRQKPSLKFRVLGFVATNKHSIRRLTSLRAHLTNAAFLYKAVKTRG